MATFTEATLRTRARRMADMENSTFVSDAEIRDYINSAYAELYDLIIEKYEDYYVKTDTAMDLSSSDTHNLPDDFYKALGVELDVGGSIYSLRNYTFQERNRHRATLYSGERLFAETQYHIQGSKIKFIPSNGSGLATLHYIPVADQINDSDTSQFTSIIPGFEEYICLTAAISCLMKEESDVQMHMARKEMLKQRIESAAGKRNAGDSYSIADVSIGRPYHFTNTGI